MNDKELKEELSKCCKSQTWQVVNSKLLRCAKCKKSFYPPEKETEDMAEETFTEDLNALTEKLLAITSSLIMRNER